VFEFGIGLISDM